MAALLGERTVIINVYDIVVGANAILYPLGLGVHHTGVEIFGTEVAYGRCGSGTGVFEVSPKTFPGHVFRESIIVGVTSLSAAEVKDVLRVLYDDPYWFGKEYHILLRNCNHFADVLSRVLLLPTPSSSSSRGSFLIPAPSSAPPQHDSGKDERQSVAAATTTIEEGMKHHRKLYRQKRQRQAPSAFLYDCGEKDYLLCHDWLHHPYHRRGKATHHLLPVHYGDDAMTGKEKGGGEKDKDKYSRGQCDEDQTAVEEEQEEEVATRNGSSSTRWNTSAIERGNEDQDDDDDDEAGKVAYWMAVYPTWANRLSRVASRCLPRSLVDWIDRMDSGAQQR